jgi:ER lumen protein retaining receptor
MTEENYSTWIVWIAGLVQTAIYCDFFWYYIKSIKEGKNIVLPL